MKEKQSIDANQHFFAASTFTWAHTNPDRNLRDLIKLMDEEGHGYNLDRKSTRLNSSHT